MICKKCGQEFDGNLCPNCGEPDKENNNEMITKPKKKKRNIIITVIVVVLAISFIGFIFGERDNSESNTPVDKKTDQKQEQPPQKQEETNKPNIEYYLTATELIEEVNENGVAADNKYEDKIIQVTGKIRSIDSDIAGRSYITFDNDNNKYDIVSIQCYFDKNDIEQIVNLKPDETVTVYGTYKNRTLNVSLKNCQIVTE